MLGSAFWRAFWRVNFHVFNRLIVFFKLVEWQSPSGRIPFLTNMQYWLWLMTFFSCLIDIVNSLITANNSNFYLCFLVFLNAVRYLAPRLTKSQLAKSVSHNIVVHFMCNCQNWSVMLTVTIATCYDMKISLLWPTFLHRWNTVAANQTLLLEIL